MKAAGEMQAFGAHREAVDYCELALAANKRSNAVADSIDLEIQIRERMFVSQEVYNWWSKDFSTNLHRIQDLRNTRGEKDAQLWVVNGLAGAELLSGKLGKAKGLANYMLDLQSNPRELAKIFSNRILGICEFYSANFETAIEHHQEVCRLSEFVDDKQWKQFYNTNVKVVAQLFMAWAKILSTDLQLGDDDISKTLALAEEDDDDITRLYAFCVSASCYQALDAPDEVLKYAEKGVILAEAMEQSYWHAWAMIQKGWALARLGSYHDGIASIDVGIDEYKRTETGQILPYASVLRCQSLFYAGRMSEAEDLADQLTSDLNSHELRFIDQMVHELHSMPRHKS